MTFESRHFCSSLKNVAHTLYNVQNVLFWKIGLFAGQNFTEDFLKQPIMIMGLIVSRTFCQKVTRAEA